MDDSFLFDWLKDVKGEPEEPKEETKTSSKGGKTDLSGIAPSDFEKIFKHDDDLTESQRTAKEVLKDYMMLIYIMRSAAKTPDATKLMMISLDPDQIKKVITTISERYGPTDEVTTSIASQMLMAQMIGSVIGSKYNVPPKS